jgi:hypothetical protein
MCFCLSRQGLWTEVNGASKAALFLVFYEGNRRFRESLSPLVLSLSFYGGNRFDEFKNEQAAQNKTF